MIIILTGPPGAGKGTQADLLVSRNKFHKFSTGDALRNQVKQGTEIGKKAQGYMSKGRLVPDEILTEVLKDEFRSLRGARILLDGYPRNMNQVKTLDALSDEFPVAKVISINVPNEMLVSRICGRRVCSSCGASFHEEFAPPSKIGVCDKCGGPLEQRDDDTREKASVRLGIYEEDTKPILEYYSEKSMCQIIDGTGAEEEVYERLVKAIDLS